MASALWRCPVFRCLLLLAFCVHSSEGELPRAAWHGVTLNGFWSNFQSGTYYSACECVEFIRAHSSSHHILFSAFYPWNLFKKKKKEKKRREWFEYFALNHWLFIEATHSAFHLEQKLIVSQTLKSFILPSTLWALWRHECTECRGHNHFTFTCSSKSLYEASTPATVKSRVCEIVALKNPSSFFF